MKLRFTLRKLMILIAVVAVATGGLIAARRYREHLRVQASRFKKLEREHMMTAFAYQSQLREVEGTAGGFEQLSISTQGGDAAARAVAAEKRGQAARIRRWVDRERELREKYRAAAARPWVDVPPDPEPPPEMGKPPVSHFLYIHGAGTLDPP